MNVISVRGGKVHSSNPGMGEDTPFPLCPGGMRNTRTRYQLTAAELTCKTCLTYAERRKLRAEIEEAHDAALFMHEMWEEKQAHMNATKFERAYNKACDANTCERCLADAQINADDTAAERGFAEYSERWYEIAAMGIGVTHSMHVAQDEGDAEYYEELREGADMPERTEVHLTESLMSWLSGGGGWSGEEGETIAADLHGLDWTRGRGASGSVSYDTLIYLVEAIETITGLPEFRHESRAGARFLAEHAGKVEGAPAKLHPIIAKLTSKKGSDMAKPSAAATRHAEVLPPDEPHTRGEHETMPPETKASTATKKTLKELDDVINSMADSETDLATAAAEAMDVVRRLPKARQPDARARVQAAREEADQARRPGTPSADVSYAHIPGLTERVQRTAERARKAVEAGTEAGHLALAVAADMLEIRLRITHKATGLPDLSGHSAEARSTASDVYQAVAAGLNVEDDARHDALESLKVAVRNRNSDTISSWIRALDGFPPDDQESRVSLLRQYFPPVADAVAKDPSKSATEMVYRMYEEAGSPLPRRGRVEIQREKRRLKALEASRAELEEAKDSGDEKLAAKIENKVTELEGSLPADVLKRNPRKETTPQERAFARIKTSRETLAKAVEKPPKTEDERNDLARELESYVGWLTGEIAKLKA